MNKKRAMIIVLLIVAVLFAAMTLAVNFVFDDSKKISEPSNEGNLNGDINVVVQPSAGNPGVK